MALYYLDNLTDKLDDAKLLIYKLQQAKYKPDTGYATHIGFDTETTGLDPYTAQVLLIQIKVGEDIFILNRGKLGLTFVKNIVQLIKDSNVLCVGHNIKFDMKMIFSDTGLWLTNVYDTMIAESVITSGLGGRYVSLQYLVEKYCGVLLEKETTIEFITMNHDSVFTEQQLTYSATDVLYLDKVREAQMEQIEHAKLQRTVALECAVEPVVAKMEMAGITLDIPYWADLTDNAKRKVIVLKETMKDVLFSALPTKNFSSAFEFATAVAIPVSTKKLRATLESIIDPDMALSWVKENFNIGSPKQLLTALNLAGIKTASTDEKVLNKLPSNTIIDTILEFRGYQKMISTYGYNVIEAVNPVTGRIHADFNQVGTASGRFSSSGGVNMQNIPTHNGYREGFIAREGYTLCAVDYSQQEYRLAGAISKEPMIIDAYVRGFDMHTATAALRFGKKLDDVTKDERNKGKAVNFTILYGGTEFALGKNLDMPQDEARALLAQFLANYPVLAKHKELTENKIAEMGYSVTLMGRRRYWKTLPAFSTPQEIVNHENKMKREGYNHIIQGTGADVTKLAMVKLDANNPFGDLFIPILQVHDEVVAEIHDSILAEGEAFMIKEMTEAFQPFLGEIPAKVDSKLSKRWTKS